MNSIPNLIRRFNLLFGNKPGFSPPDPSAYWRADIHSHLLPGVDDGVVSLEQTLVSLRQLAAWGIRHVVTTPHVSQDWYPNTAATLLDGQTTLRALVAEHQLPLTIEVAAEYLLDDLFLDLLRAGQLLSFGRRRYVLFETGWASPPNFLNEIIFQLLTQGYQPLLAHPERYPYYHKDPKKLGELRDLGCLFQLNWGSITGRYGRRVKTQAHKLLTNQWVDFIGSDLHQPGDLDALGQLFTAPDYPLLSQQPLRNSELTEPPKHP